ncbi:hypothetical protein JXO52_11910 [bacterium]|nr:hypothetical protein [bacterium]
MKKLTALLLVLLPISSLLAQDTITGTYSYTYGDSESLVEARQTCKDLALREAIESYSVFVQSSTDVENYQLKSDIITTISGGNLKNVTVIDQKEEGRKITMTVSAEVDPEEIKALIEQARASFGKAAETTVADTAGADEGDSPFLEALEKHKLDLGDTSGGSVDPDRLLELFRTYKPSEKNTFQWLVYQSLLKRMEIVKGLRTLKELETGNKPVRARAQMRRVDAMALELFRLVRQIQNSELQKTRLKVLRARWVSQCRELLQTVKTKSDHYSRR